MSRRPALRALQLLTSQAWAIRREALEQMIAIAERDVDAMMGEALGLDGGKTFYAPNGIDRALDHHALFAAPATAHPQSDRIGVRDGVAILPIIGPLCRYASFFQEVCGMTSYQLAAEDFRIAIEDPAVRAILLHLDSPGGETNGCSELAAFIHAHRGVKPIVAMVSDGAASAAYWIAAAADEIVVSPSAYVGSIGVYWEIEDSTERDAARGLRRFRVVSSQSPNKVPDPEDPAGKAVLQRAVDEFADAFIGAAAAYRGMDPAALIAAGDGGAVFIGRFAVERGLADRVSTTEAVMAELAGRAFSPSTAGSSIARAATNPQESLMPRKTNAGAQASGPRAYAAGDEVRSLVARETTIAEGATGPIEEVREGVTVLRLETADGPSGWLIAGEEAELANAEQPADPPADDAGTAAEGDEVEDPDDEDVPVATIASVAAAHPALVAEIRQQAVQAERQRVLSLCALDARQASPTLVAAITAGHLPGKAARALLEASRKPGAAALAAMAGAEATLTPPAPMASGADAPTDAQQITSLLEEHGGRRRARRASLN